MESNGAILYFHTHSAQTTAYGELDPLGTAPVLWPDSPGTHGLLTPVLSTGPVAIDALLAPDPAIPPSLVEPAIEVVGDEPPVCDVRALVRLQAGLELCARTGPAKTALFFLLVG